VRCGYKRDEMQISSCAERVLFLDGAHLQGAVHPSLDMS